MDAIITKSGYLIITMDLDNIRETHPSLTRRTLRSGYKKGWVRVYVGKNHVGEIFI